MVDQNQKDPKFVVEIISKIPKPQQVIWAAMHQDYSEELVWDGRADWPYERKAGELVVKHLLNGGRGHYGPIEHPQIVFNVGYYPHSVMQQVRTHRVGISFDVQSGRYSGIRICDVVSGKRALEDVFYLRPMGHYTNRQGERYEYTDEQRKLDLAWCAAACERYEKMTSDGMPKEQARGTIPFDFRQHFVLSCNVRSLMHLLDLRWKKDAQLEAQFLCDQLFFWFKYWCPEIADWYLENRAKKARLSP